MFTHTQFGEVQNVQSLLLEELLRIAERYKKKAHILHVTTKEELIFYHSTKEN